MARGQRGASSPLPEVDFSLTPARARVDRIAPFDRLGIWLGRTQPDINLIVEPAILSYRAIDRVDTAVSMEPSLMLDEDVARALLDALAQHFGGTSEAQTLRRDYLAERDRVDKMIAYLISRGI